MFPRGAAMPDAGQVTLARYDEAFVAAIKTFR